MPRYQLSENTRHKIELQVDRLFDRLLSRFVGIGPKVVGFEIVHDPVLSLPGLFASAAVEGGTSEPDKGVMHSLLRISANYINGIRERTKALVLNEMEAAVARTGTENMADVMKELDGRLSDLWIKITADLKRVIETQSTSASNQGLFDGITKVTQNMGINDPTVFFVPVRDGLLCDECKRLHLMPDGIVPRVWKMSEVSMNYHVKGEDRPSVHELHPNGRCTLTALLPGFGFDSAGMVTWISPDHDELQKQRQSSIV